MRRFGIIFQDFLIKYKSLIGDLSDIKCSYQQDDEYYMTPVSVDIIREKSTVIQGDLGNSYAFILYRVSVLISSCSNRTCVAAVVLWPMPKPACSSFLTRHFGPPCIYNFKRID